MKKIIIICAVALFAISTVSANDSVSVENCKYRNYFVMDFGGGMHTYLYKTNDGKVLPSAGGLFHIGYQLMFSKHWGFGFQVGVSSYRTLADYYFKLTQEGATHPMNNLPFTSYADFKYWRESQNVIQAELPVEFYFATPTSNDWNFQLGFGAIVSTAVWAQYNGGGEYTTTGYFPDIHGTVYDLPDYGFSTYRAAKNGKIDVTSYNVGAILELGGWKHIAERADFYIGCYANCQFLSSVKSSDAPLYDGNQMKYVGTLNSNEVKDKIYPLEAGIKLGFRFGGCSKKAMRDAAEKERLEKEQAEKERLAREQAEEERLAKEQAEKERLAREQAEKERLAKEQAEKERLAREQAEKERIARLAAEKQAEFEKYAGVMLVGSTFETGKADIKATPEIKAAIAGIKKFLEENPNVSIKVVGHTDNVGKPERNIEYGQKRADAFKAWLVGQGIDAARITTESKGQTEPIATNDTEEGRAKNRRVEMKVEVNPSSR